jgi:hypothetical protein
MKTLTNQLKNFQDDQERFMSDLLTILRRHDLPRVWFKLVQCAVGKLCG